MTALASILTIQIQTPNWGSASSYESKVKFNPSEKTLKDRISNLTFIIGKYDVGFPSIMQTKEYSTSQIRITQATAISNLHMLPVLTDYIDIEELHDVEKMEDAFYEASRKFSW